MIVFQEKINQFNLKIKGVDSENDFFIGTVDSISIPLSNYQNTTPFSFTKEFDSNQSNEDLIYFNYLEIMFIYQGLVDIKWNMKLKTLLLKMII